MVDLGWVRDVFDSVYNLPQLLAWGGYFILFAIIFAETGLFFGFFLPGDSLLVTAGLLSATGLFKIHWLILLACAAAIAGDAVGYYFGHRVGQALFKREDNKFFKKEYLLRTKAFYDRHGGKTIVLARFIPIIRTFAPIVAGTAGMEYRKFASYNVFGGIFWVSSMSLIGFFLVKIFPKTQEYLHWVILIVILLSFVPAVVEYLRHRKLEPAL